MDQILQVEERLFKITSIYAYGVSVASFPGSIPKLRSVEPGNEARIRAQDTAIVNPGP